MPEDSDREGLRRRPERLDGAVVRLCGHAQPVSEPAKTLMVVRLDRRRRAEHREEPLVLDDLDVVVCEDTGRLLVLLVADDVGEVLPEITAECDVQDLRAAADGKYGQVALERRC